MRPDPHSPRAFARTLEGPHDGWSWHIEQYDGTRRSVVEGIGTGSYATAAEAADDAEKALAALLALQQPAPAAYMHGR